MPRHVFYRDFTICKAIALVGLMGLALALGGVPHKQPGLAEAATPEAVVIPAAVYKVWDDCVPADEGVEL